MQDYHNSRLEKLEFNYFLVRQECLTYLNFNNLVEQTFLSVVLILLNLQTSK